MCGIAGLIEKGAREEDARSMIAAMVHRGPDDSGVVSHARVALGMCRLSIIDLSPAGHQPMVSADGNFTLVFNGEIYNYLELKSELIALGAKFRSNSDTEVILEGYARWGRDVVGRLRGMWAFAIHDAARDEVFLCRDPFGIKPLYLYDDGATVAFSSEIKGILAHPRASRDMNPEAVKDLLLLGYILAPRTILQHACALLPGEEITILAETRHRESRIVPLSYDPASAHTPPSDEELFALLEDSVRHHLIADVPVGLFYSGGIDSATLATILHRIGADLTAYHVALEGRSDTPYARSIAKALGVRMVEIPFTAADVPHALTKLFSVMDQPFADASLLPTLIVSERAARDVKVALAGEGGDELFAGYDRHGRMGGIAQDQNQMMAERSRFRIWENLISRVSGLVHFLPKIQGALRFSAERRKDLVGMFFAETAITAGLVNEASARDAVVSRLSAREAPDGPLACDRLIYLPDDLLAKTDIATMAFSLEGRVPFLDRKVFSAIAASPLSWKRAGGISKAPLRRLLAQSFPRELIDRPKTGFSIPLSSYIFAHERERIHAAIEWYLCAYDGLLPAFSAALRWGMTHPSNMATLERVLAYGLYAVLTLFMYDEKCHKKSSPS